MPDFELKAEPFLGGRTLDMDGTSLNEETGLSIVSIATPLGGEDALTAAVEKAWGCALPASCKTTNGGDVTLISATADSYLALLPAVDGLAIGGVADALGDAGYYTEQTDNWVAIRISGPKAVEALERICPLDLDDEAMPIGAAQRTVMEHLGVFILRKAKDGFLLLSGSSSAASFLHAVELSIKNVH
ncbi:MAG: sarcosine oxidase subunit gamma [Pseudomonadota bacterium]